MKLLWCWNNWSILVYFFIPIQMCSYIFPVGMANAFAEPAAGKAPRDAAAGATSPEEFSWLVAMPGVVSPYKVSARYDLRELNLVTPVKNQNGLRSDGISDLGASVGLCWAFASLSSFESSLLKQGIVAAPTDRTANLSPWHLGNYIGYNMPVYEMDMALMPGVEPATTMGYVKPEGGWGGGGAFWTSDYMIRGDGPVLWSDAPMPLTRMSNHEILSKPPRGTPVNYLVKEMLMLDPDDFADRNGNVDARKFREKIKRALLKYGAIQSFIHLEAIDCPGVDNQTCNGRTYSGHRFMDKVRNNLYTYETEKLCSDVFTHAVSIVGWDDNRLINLDGHVSKGAWLIKDSIGENSHDHGYFWVAYDDRVHLQFIASAFVALSGAGYKHPSSYQTHAGGLTKMFPGEDAVLNDENIIALGSYGYLLDGYNRDAKDSWAFARFPLANDEILKGVGIFTSNPGQLVVIRVYNSWDKVTADRDKPLYEQEFTVAERGYHLLNFDREISLAAGEELIVGAGFPFAPGSAREPMVIVRDNMRPGTITYRASNDPVAGWSELLSYDNVIPGYWSGFFLQAVMASTR